MSFPETEEERSNVCSCGTSSSEEEKRCWETTGEGYYPAGTEERNADTADHLH